MRRALAIVVLVCGSVLARGSTNSFVAGKLTVRVYSEDAVKDLQTGTFELAKTVDKYALRIYQPHSEADFKIFVASNYDATFASETVEIGPQRRPRSPSAQGVFVVGPLPTKFDLWAAPQVLALATALVDPKIRAKAVKSDGVLVDNYSPLHFIQRARAGSANLISRVLNPVSEHPTVEFWARTSGKDVALGQTNDSWLLGKLDILQTDNGLPSELKLVTYTIALDDSNRIVLHILSDYAFTAEKTMLQTDLFRDIAFDRNIDVRVVDQRYDLRSPLQYDLHPGDVVPFENEQSATLAAVQKTKQYAVAMENANLYRSRVILTLMALAISIIAGLVIVRINKKRSKNE